MVNRLPARICIATSVHPDYDARVFRHALSVARMGYDVDLICPWKICQQVLPDNLHLVAFERVVGRRQRLLAHMRLLRTVLRRRYDLYHFHDIDVLPLFAALRVVLRRPVIYDCHEYYAQEVKHRPYRIPRVAKRAMELAVTWGEPALARLVGNVVIVVPQQSPLFPQPPVNVLMLRNFADAELEQGRADDYLTRPDACIALGSQFVENGALFLLDVAEQVKVRLPDVKFYSVDRFHGNAALREHVLRETSRRGLTSHVEMLPNVPATDVMRYLNRATIGLGIQLPKPGALPALPTKLFEYMAAGIPMVTADLPNAREAVEDAACGFLPPAGDAAAFADAICRLVADRKAAWEMGQSGLRAFRAKFNWQVEAGKLKPLYEALLSGHAS